jgi:hypothetical protein
MNSKTRDDAASAATDCSRSIVPDGHGHRVFVIQKEQSCNRELMILLRRDPAQDLCAEYTRSGRLVTERR